MGRSERAPGLDELESRLKQDEKWLSGFQSLLKRNSTITRSVSKSLDDFSGRVASLSGNVNSLYAKTSVIHREQQNVKKLLNIVEATMQFHGKSQDFENTIRGDGNLTHNLHEYIEKMNSLKEAITFFSSHPTYQSQLNHMKSIFETGCESMQAEFGNQVKLKSINLNPMRIFECLDDEYEMIDDGRLAGLITLKEGEQQNMIMIATWLRENASSSTQHLNYFLNYRSENMLKTLKSISDQLGASSKTSKAKFIKKALRKIGDKLEQKGGGDHYSAELSGQKENSSIAIVLFMLSAFLVLLKLEMEVCSAVFNNVKLEAALIRQMMNDPLRMVLHHNLKVIDSFDGSFEAILPLAKFFMAHANQIQSLCEMLKNIGEGEAYCSLRERIRNKTEKAISGFVDHSLVNDHNKLVPKDANVLHLTSSTLHLLKVANSYLFENTHMLFAQNRPLLTYIYDERRNADQKFNLARLLVQILTALGTNLRTKAASYSDESIGAIFMLNNLAYLISTLTRDANLSAILASDQSQVISFYQVEAEEYLNRYLQNWSKVAAVFPASTALSDERRMAKNVFSNFNKEFDSVLEAQRNCCLADASMAPIIRRRVKELVLRPYAEFTSKISGASEDFDADRQMKYDAETVELIIDRLFEAG